MKFSLRLKLILSFLLLISIPISILGALSYNMSSKALQNTIEQELQQITDLTSETISATLTDMEAALQLASENTALSKAIVQADNVEAKTDSFHYLGTVQKRLDNAESILLADTQGTVIVTNDSQAPEINVSDRAYFKDALGGKAIISDIIVSKVSNKPVVAIAQPVSSDGQVVGVLIATVGFESITDHAKKIKVGENGYAYMIDDQGLFVYHPTTEKVLKDNIKDIQSAELQALVPKMLAGETGYGFYTYNNVYKYVRFIPAGNWTLVLTAEYKEYMRPALNIRRDTVYIALSCVFAAMVIAFLISTYNIVAPIKKLQKLMARAGEGDLTVVSDIRSKDEIAELSKSFNLMIKHQNEIVAQVRSGAQELAGAAEEMAASTEQISSASEQINSNVQEVAVGAQNQNDSIINSSQVLLQLSSLVQLAKDKAYDTNQNAVVTMNAADVGRGKVDKTKKAIETINMTTRDTYDVLNLLDELSNKIGGIIVTINSLAEQTNLLALNAAIEAARAGEHGKGFAVVADEVRKLSEQSNHGAGEIEQLVNEMITQTQKAVKSINEGKDAVENGVKIVAETDISFIEIINAVEKIAKNIKEIVEITNDEVATSDQVIKLIDNVASITESTTSSCQEVAAAVEEETATLETIAGTAEEMSAMAIGLDNLVKKFKIEV